MRAEIHLIEVHRLRESCACGCGQIASRFARCRRKRCVIATCGARDVVRDRDVHERMCAA